MTGTTKRVDYRTLERPVDPTPDVPAPASSAPGTAVAERPVAEVPAALAEQLLADAAAPRDYAARDVAIPFLAIIQSNSPQCSKLEAEYIEGAQQGMFFGSVTGQLWEGNAGVLLVPAGFRKIFKEWVPRSKGGGYIGEHAPNSEVVAKAPRGERGRLVSAAGNDLVETAEHYVYVLVGGGAYEPAVVSLSSTQLRKSRNWLARITSVMIPYPNDPSRRFNPAPFYMTYRATVVPEKNEKGSWWGWQFQPHAPVFDLPGGAEVYAKARELRELVRSGQVRTAQPPGGPAETPGEADDSVPF